MRKKKKWYSVQKHTDDKYLCICTQQEFNTLHVICKHSVHKRGSAIGIRQIDFLSGCCYESFCGVNGREKKEKKRKKKKRKKRRKEEEEEGGGGGKES